MARPVKIFVSYAHEDRTWCDRLLAHMGGLRHSNRIATFDDKQLKPGEQWDARIKAELDAADILIAMLSADFVGSRYCSVDELLRSRNGGTHVVPILVDHCAFETLHVGDLQIVPQDDKRNLLPLTDWPNANKPLASITRAIASLVKELGEAKVEPARPFTAPGPSRGEPTTKSALAEAPPKPFVAATPAERSWMPGEVFRDIDASWCPEMVVIPAGQFTMGSPPEEQRQAIADGAKEEWVKPEGPQRRVVIGKPFALGKHAVTFAEFREFVVDACHHHNPEAPFGAGRMPVVNVTWEDTKAYCKWLSARTKAEYRLPSEAEWEYACRAGTETAFSCGPTISTDQANYNGNHTYASGKKGSFREKTVPVDEFRPNAFGLHQMHGNVWEWCEDPWHDSYIGAPRDGSVWTLEGNMSRRVLRGGCWFISPGYLRAAFRSRYAPDGRDVYAGFRVARMLTP